MRAFIVKLENKPGTLADLGEALGERGINITGLSGTTWDGDGALAVITNDDAGARTVRDDRELPTRLRDRSAASGQAGALGAAGDAWPIERELRLIMTTGVQGTGTVASRDDPGGSRALGSWRRLDRSRSSPAQRLPATAGRRSRIPYPCRKEPHPFRVVDKRTADLAPQRRALGHDRHGSSAAVALPRDSACPRSAPRERRRDQLSRGDEVPGPQLGSSSRTDRCPSRR